MLLLRERRRRLCLMLMLLRLQILLRLHARRMGITPHFLSLFQITDPSLITTTTTILHHEQRHHLFMVLNHSHRLVNLNHFHRHQLCSLPSLMFRTILLPLRLRVIILLRVIFRVVMQLSGLLVNLVD